MLPISRTVHADSPDVLKPVLVERKLVRNDLCHKLIAWMLSTSCAVRVSEGDNIDDINFMYSTVQHCTWYKS